MSRTASWNADHVKSWGEQPTTAKDSIAFHTHRPRTGIWSDSGHRVNKTSFSHQDHFSNLHLSSVTWLADCMLAQDQHDCSFKWLSAPFWHLIKEHFPHEYKVFFLLLKPWVEIHGRKYNFTDTEREPNSEWLLWRTCFPKQAAWNKLTGLSYFRICGLVGTPVTLMYKTAKKVSSSLLFPLK